MTLVDYCRKITSSQYPLISDNHPISKRLVCAEYSKSFHRLLPFTPVDDEQFFVMCWNFMPPCTLYSTMYPSDRPSYHIEYFVSGQKTQLHTHDFVELGYIVKGFFKQRINNVDVTFQEGELYLIDKNCFHQDYLIDSDSIILFIGVEDSMLSEIMNPDISKPHIITFLKQALSKQKKLQQYLHFKSTTKEIRMQMEQLLLVLTKELHNNMTGSNYIAKGILLRIFQLLSYNYSFTLIHDQQAALNWIVYEEICNYIQQHYSTVNTKKLAETFHYQEDYYNRVFKKYSGVTYTSYVQDIRLQKAKDLIVNTDKHISEIIAEIGYRNTGHFHKVFKKKYGITPQQYRQTYKK